MEQKKTNTPANALKVTTEATVEFNPQNSTIALLLKLPSFLKMQTTANRHAAKDGEGCTIGNQTIDKNAADAAIELAAEMGWQSAVVTDDDDEPVAVRIEMPTASGIAVPTTTNKTYDWKRINPDTIERDEITLAIREAGDIRNHRMWKQWVMAQVCEHIFRSHYDSNAWRTVYDRDADGNLIIDTKRYYHKIHAISVGASFGIVLRKLIEQKMMLRHGDRRCYDEDSKIFNKALVVEMCKSYIGQSLPKYLNSLKQRSCKGKLYIRPKHGWYPTHGKSTRPSSYKGIFVADLPAIYDIYNSLLAKINNNDHFEVWLGFFEEFCNKMMPLDDWGFVNNEYTAIYRCCEAFEQSYIAYGAFFTMQNLIRFHGCCIFEHQVAKRRGEVVMLKLDREQSLEKLNGYLDEYAAGRMEGYKLFGVLRCLINDNRWDYEKARAAWKK